MRPDVEQFLFDLEDWLNHRGGTNTFISRRMVERTRFLTYWIGWLGRTREEEGLPRHVDLNPPPKDAA